MAYIYKVVNNITQKIYVGKTECTLEKRFREHCKDAFRSRNEKRPLYSAMRKYGVENFHIELIEETDNPEEREIYWINKLDTYKNGYNATFGGDGKKYVDYSLVLSTFKKLNSVKDTAKELDICVQTVSKVLHQNEIYPECTSRQIFKDKAMTVYQYDKEGLFIQTFSSLCDAARWCSANGSSLNNKHISTGHISACTKGKRKTAYGYIWKLE